MMARREGYQIVAVQQTPDSQPYHQAAYPPRPLLSWAPKIQDSLIYLEKRLT